MPACLLRVFRATRNRLINVCAGPSRRPFSSQSHERVRVRTGSAGYVNIDLINVAEHHPQSPLFIHLPPFPTNNGQYSSLPNFLQGKPVASINYRWNSFDPGLTQNPSTEGLWPTPVHDTAFAYSWLIENLAPEGIQRRDIYVYGSHLGASLATSLALTESQPHKPFGVRGAVLYNGIYNWTMFLPDHPVNKTTWRSKGTGFIYKPQGSAYMHYLQEHLPVFFQSTNDLFDPFASPSLFFHNPGLNIPSSYNMSEDDAAWIEALTNPDAAPAVPEKAPRKSRLVFPPRKSTLKIPETLLLYDSPPLPQRSNKPGRPKGARPWGNCLEVQARELAEMMHRSIERVELKERGLWDDEIYMWEDEGDRRVKVEEVGEERGTLEMDEKGGEVVEEWLAERIRA
ncbi:hypothetical protein NCS52_00261700 [Fusarium sp. LHS14.1]|nr:hypothetical protein NCS52_00261700 [Fusarium sp. LHS14.1]